MQSTVECTRIQMHTGLVPRSGLKQKKWKKIHTGGTRQRQHVCHAKNLIPESDSSGLTPGISSAFPSFDSACTALLSIHNSMP